MARLHPQEDDGLVTQARVLGLKYPKMSIIVGMDNNTVVFAAPSIELAAETNSVQRFCGNFQPLLPNYLLHQSALYDVHWLLSNSEVSPRIWARVSSLVNGVWVLVISSNLQ